MKHRIPICRYTPPRISQQELDFQQVQEIMKGAEELWEPLYSASYHMVLQCAAKADYSHLLGPPDYRDITDEAFALCYAQLERYRGRSRFSRWVGGYAKNITRNRCSRERTRRRNQRLLEDAADARMDGCDPLLILIRLERDQCLWRAFYELSETDRRIVESRLFENTAPRAIARELDMTRREVLRRYDAALVSLRWNFNRYYHICPTEKAG